MRALLFIALGLPLARARAEVPSDPATFVSFTSIADGQPAAAWHLQAFARMAMTSDHSELVPQLALTPGESGWRADSLFGVTMPVVSFSAQGSAEYRAAPSAFWQQRWFAQDGWFPTLATVVAGSATSEDHAFDETVTLALIEAMGPVVLYTSLWYHRPGGRHAAGGLVGCKLPINDRIEVAGAARMESGARSALELAAMVTVLDGVTVGPGAMIEDDRALTLGVLLAAGL